MSAHDEDHRIQQLLKQALPPAGADADGDPEPTRDLWPAMLRRLEAHPAAQPRPRWLWFDWALLAGLAAVTVTFPASLTLLLYYL